MRRCLPITRHSSLVFVGSLFGSVQHPCPTPWPGRLPAPPSPSLRFFSPPPFCPSPLHRFPSLSLSKEKKTSPHHHTHTHTHTRAPRIHPQHRKAWMGPANPCARTPMKRPRGSRAGPAAPAGCIALTTRGSGRGCHVPRPRPSWRLGRSMHPSTPCFSFIDKTVIAQPPTPPLVLPIRCSRPSPAQPSPTCPGAAAGSPVPRRLRHHHHPSGWASHTCTCHIPSFAASPCLQSCTMQV